MDFNGIGAVRGSNFDTYITLVPGFFCIFNVSVSDFDCPFLQLVDVINKLKMSNLQWWEPYYILALGGNATICKNPAEIEI